MSTGYSHLCEGARDPFFLRAALGQVMSYMNMKSYQIVYSLPRFSANRNAVSLHRVHRRHLHDSQGGANLGGKLGTDPESRGWRHPSCPLQEQPSSVSLFSLRCCRLQSVL